MTGKLLPSVLLESLPIGLIPILGRGVPLSTISLLGLLTILSFIPKPIPILVVTPNPIVIPVPIVNPVPIVIVVAIPFLMTTVLVLVAILVLILGSIPKTAIILFVYRCREIWMPFIEFVGRNMAWSMGSLIERLEVRVEWIFGSFCLSSTRGKPVFDLLVRNKVSPMERKA